MHKVIRYSLDMIFIAAHHTSVAIPQCTTLNIYMVSSQQVCKHIRLYFCWKWFPHPSLWRFASFFTLISSLILFTYSRDFFGLILVNKTPNCESRVTSVHHMSASSKTSSAIQTKLNYLFIHSGDFGLW